MQGSERWNALAVGYPHTDRDWGWESAQVGNGVVVGQQGHHGNNDDVVVVVLHGTGRAPLWARCQVLIWGRQVQVWVRAGAPVHWRWDNGDDDIIVVVAFVVVDEGGGLWGCSVGTGGEWGRWGVGLTEWALFSPLLQQLNAKMYTWAQCKSSCTRIVNSVIEGDIDIVLAETVRHHPKVLKWEI
jgi:hypothetical protein